MNKIFEYSSKSKLITIVDLNRPAILTDVNLKSSAMVGTFGVSDTPPATIFVDDLKVNEPATSNTSTQYSVSLSSAQASAVTFDYAIVKK